ncbi:MAG: TRAP transporter small permease [Planctomycetaceae bacterium]|nr:TRAP transporter small permease [Planctomycetaceae bacterium]
MIKFLDGIDYVLRKILVSIAGAFLLAMLAITVANIIMRRLGMPIQGTYELTGLFGAIVCACVLGYTQKRKENIAVDIIVNHFPKSLRLVAAILNDTACTGFSILAAWQIMKIGLKHLESGEVTETLRIVAYPFIFITAAGFAALAFVFVIDLLKNFVSKDTSVKPLSTSVEVNLEEGVQ